MHVQTDSTRSIGHVAADGLLPLVLYDGGCSTCRREIAHYRRLRGAECLMWVDISEAPRLHARFGITHAQAMAQFHVRDRSARWHVGTAAFVELWSHLPYYRQLAAFLRGLRLAGILDLGYRRFAKWRLRRRCTGGACSGADPAVYADRARAAHPRTTGNETTLN